jgi:hypothetical protein
MDCRLGDCRLLIENRQPTPLPNCRAERSIEETEANRNAESKHPCRNFARKSPAELGALRGDRF